jgi:hypothetical protein
MATIHSIGMFAFRRAALGLALCANLTSLACANDSLSPGISAAQLCARQDSLVATQQPYPTLNETFDTMARLLPGGFAGLAVDSWFLQTAELADTARKTAAILGACPHAQAPNLWAIVQTTPVHAVAYSWLQLRDWDSQLLKGGLDGLVTAGIDILHNRVACTVRSQQDVETFRARARDLKIPDDALDLTIGSTRTTAFSRRPSNER